MDDPFDKLQQISNPSTVSIFEKDGKRILLLGDFHTKNNKECARCIAPECYDYIGLIKALDKYHKTNSTDLDVFVETFAPNFPKRRLELYLKQAAIPFEKVLRKFIPSFNLNLVRTRTNLHSKLFLHGKDPNVHQRYHYTDFRFTKLFEDYKLSTKDIVTIDYLNIEDAKKYETTMKEEFFTFYPTKTKFIDTLTDFVFGNPFDPKYPHRELLSHEMTRIAKQFYKIESTYDQQIIKAFAISKIKKVANAIWSTNVSFLEALFESCLILMDMYAICRFVRYFRLQPEGSSSVFLAGAWHCENYREFLKKWGAKETFYKETIPIKNTRQNVNKMTRASKCISLNKTRRARK